MAEKVGNPTCPAFLHPTHLHQPDHDCKLPIPLDELHSRRHHTATTQKQSSMEHMHVRVGVTVRCRQGTIKAVNNCSLTAGVLHHFLLPTMQMPRTAELYRP
jgi:hypothetical protein